MFDRRQLRRQGPWQSRVGERLAAVEGELDGLDAGVLGPRDAGQRDVARGVDSANFGVLYDIYHSAVEGEDMAAELVAQPGHRLAK